jgi:hypothetical protein
MVLSDVPLLLVTLLLSKAVRSQGLVGVALQHPASIPRYINA